MASSTSWDKLPFAAASESCKSWTLLVAPMTVVAISGLKRTNLQHDEAALRRRKTAVLVFLLLHCTHGKARDSTRLAAKKVTIATPAFDTLIKSSFLLFK